MYLFSKWQKTILVFIKLNYSVNIYWAPIALHQPFVTHKLVTRHSQADNGSAFTSLECKKPVHRIFHLSLLCLFPSRKWLGWTVTSATLKQIVSSKTQQFNSAGFLSGVRRISSALLIHIKLMSFQTNWNWSIPTLLDFKVLFWLLFCTVKIIKWMSHSGDHRRTVHKGHCPGRAKGYVCSVTVIKYLSFVCSVSVITLNNFSLQCLLKKRE